MPSPTLFKITKCKYLWEGWSYFVYLLHEVIHPWKLQCYHVVLVEYGPACPKFCKITNWQYLWKEFGDLVDFLHVVICILLVDTQWSYKNMLFWAGIVMHRLSADQIVICFKLKNLENCITYYVEFLFPLKLQMICYFGFWLQSVLDAN